MSLNYFKAVFVTIKTEFKLLYISRCNYEYKIHCAAVFVRIIKSIVQVKMYVMAVKSEFEISSTQNTIYLYILILSRARLRSKNVDNAFFWSTVAVCLFDI